MIGSLNILVLITWTIYVLSTPIPEQFLKTIQQTESQEIQRYMNESMDPCENFYQFACGNWKTYYPTHANNLQTDAFTILGIADFDRQISRLLNQTDHSLYTSSEGKAKDFHRSCIRMGSIEQNHYNMKVKEILKEFGQMPAMEEEDGKWQEDEFDWLQVIGEISHKYGIIIMVGYTIVPNNLNPKKYDIFLRPQEFTIQSNFDLQRETYKDNMIQKLDQLFSMDLKVAEKVADELLDFEAELWKASQLDLVADYKTISLEAAQEEYFPDFDAKRLLNISYGSIPADVMIDSCSYIESLVNIIQRTPKRIIANYVFYYLLQPFALKIPDNEAKLQDHCVGQLEKYFAKILSYLFYRKNNLKDNERDFIKIWHNLKLTLHQKLESSDLKWFNDAARKYALDKLQAMELYIPTFADYNLDTEYASLIMDPDNYLENMKELLTFKIAQTRSHLNMTPNIADHGLDMYSPAYLHTVNVVVVPVSMLQIDFFWSKFRSNAINYGRFGALLAHEVIHGFSGTGLTFNSSGYSVRNEGIEALFEERRQCLYNQYHNYSYGGQYLPQDYIQDENIADNGGVQLALEAYRRWYEEPHRTTEEFALEIMPTLGYDQNQLFFISYAQLWCADAYEAQRSLIAASDEHAPDEFRAFIPLTNSHEFANAFQCPLGSPMNPEQKCEIF